MEPKSVAHQLLFKVIIEAPADLMKLAKTTVDWEELSLPSVVRPRHLMLTKLLFESPYEKSNQSGRPCPS
jgi:hypothetical protein